MNKLSLLQDFTRPGAGNAKKDQPGSDLGFIRRLVRTHGSPLLILDCDMVRRRFRILRRALPGVDLYYAIKTQPHVAVIRTLREEGCFFDVASNGEVDLVRECGISPFRCIHTHPVKREVDIEHSLEYGCNTFVVDNPVELRKFEKYRAHVELLLRIGFRSADAVVDLARKFGCSSEMALDLLSLAQKLGIRVKGLSFHVGSQALTPEAHAEAINTCNEIIRYCRRNSLAMLDVLDIGGGFPVDYVGDAPSPEDFCRPLRMALDRAPENVRVIAEPGRFIAAPSMISVSSVIGKARRGDRIWYYLDDGVYGSYSGRIYDKAKYPIEVSRKGGEELLPSVLAGPTCDSIDVIEESIMLPELDLGDLVIGRMMGAYTSSTATDFNFFPRATVVATNEHIGVKGKVANIW